RRRGAKESGGRTVPAHRKTRPSTALEAALSLSKRRSSLTRGLRCNRLGRGLGRIELLDYFAGDVERGVGPHQTRVRSVEDELQAHVGRDLLQDRLEPLLELLLQCLLQFLHFGLRVLREALDFERDLLD